MPPKANAKQSDRRSSTVPRRHQRQQADAICRLGTARSTLCGRIVDVSAAGAMCEFANGLMPGLGESVYFEWPDKSAVFAHVHWIDGTRLGLRFSVLEPMFADQMDTANLGLWSYARIIEMQNGLAGLKNN